MDKVSREFKLMAAKDIVSSYAKSGKEVSADQLCELFRKMYATIDDVVPAEAEHRRVGLG